MVVLELFVQGMSTKEMATTLDFTPDNVRTRVQSILTNWTSTLAFRQLAAWVPVPA
jgi:DNA-binding NarL/FixJ family response regulator